MTALVAAVAAGPRELWLAFDNEVEPPASEGISIEPRSAPAVPLRPTSLRRDGTRLVVDIDVEMTPRAQYEVTVTVLDTLGAKVAPHRASFSGFAPAAPTLRRFDLLSTLPRHVRRGADAADLEAFIAVVQEVADLVLADIDRWPDILDLERAREAFLDGMLSDLGNPFDLELDVLRKRRLAARLVDMYRRKGTAAGIEDAIRFFVGVESSVVAFAGEGLTLGEALLGVDWILGPSTSWGRFAFDVVVARVLTDEERRQVRRLVLYMKPCHTHFVSLVEPGIPPVDEGWYLGEGELGTVKLATST